VTSYEQNWGRNSGRRDLLTKMLNGDPKSGTEPLSDAEIRFEVNGLTFAAVDTTSNVMAYMMYELSLNIEWQDKLRQELLDGKALEHRANQTLKDLPVLNSVINEIIRMHSPAYSSIPRITPPEGMIIDGLKVPGNVSDV
jgi:cytochrome P450